MPKKTISAAAAVAKITANKTIIPILYECLVKQGRVYATNLTFWLELKTTLANGMYQVIGEDFVPTKSKTDEFPEPLPHENTPILFQVTTENLSPVLAKAAAFTAKSSAVFYRPELENVCLETLNGEIVITATDTHQLYRQGVRAKVETNDTRFVLPNPKIVSAILPALGELLKISDEKSYLRMTGENGSLMIRKSEEHYPDVTPIYPSFSYCHEFTKKDLLQALKTIMPYAKQNIHPRVEVVIDERKLILKFASATGVKNIKKEVSVEVAHCHHKAAKSVSDGVLVMPIKSEDKKLLLNPVYLANALRALDEEVLFLHSTDTPWEKPCLFTNYYN